MAKATSYTVRLRKAKNGDNLLLIVTNKEVTMTLAGVSVTVPEEKLVYMSRQTDPFPTEWDGCQLTSDEFEEFKWEGIEAIPDYDKAIELNPKNASAYHNRGLTQANREDYKGAIADYNKAIELEPRYAAAYLNRGFAKDKINDFQGAIADYDKTIEFDSTDAKAYNNRGVTRIKIKDYRGAIADFDKAIDLEPKFLNAHFNRGVAKASLRDYHAAVNFYDPIPDYDKAIELDSTLAYLYNNRGTAKAEQADYRDAKTDFDRAIELAPRNKLAYINRGAVKAFQGEHVGAMADFNKAIEIDSKYGFAFLNRGNAKHNLGHYHSAVADYDNASELDPSDYRVYYRRGITKNAIKDVQGAIADFTKAIELDSHNAGKYTNEGYARASTITYRPTVTKNPSKTASTPSKPKGQKHGKTSVSAEQYAADMSAILKDNPTFWKIYEYNIKKTQHLTTQEILSPLDRGTAIIDDYSTLTKYIASYGGHHYHKLQASFDRLFSELGANRTVSIIDYGCGQALASVIFFDYMLRHKKKHTVNEVILIEPSRKAVERGTMTLNYFISHFKSPAKVKVVNKKLDDISKSVLQTSHQDTTIHLFSNILDVKSFSVNTLATKIRQSMTGTNYFVCVSPLNETAENRITEFHQNFFSVSTIDKRSETLYNKVFDVQSKTMIDRYPVTMFQHIFVDDDLPI